MVFWVTRKPRRWDGPEFAEPTGSALIETLLNLQEQETCKA